MWVRIPSLTPSAKSNHMLGRPSTLSYLRCGKYLALPIIIIYIVIMRGEKTTSAGNQQERTLVDVSHDNLSYYLAGFTDADGSFSVSIGRSKFVRVGWTINPLFQIYQHKDNPRILEVFKDYFDCGNISEKGGNPLCHDYCVNSIKDLTEKVKPFFDQWKIKYIN